MIIYLFPFIFFIYYPQIINYLEQKSSPCPTTREWAEKILKIAQENSWPNIGQLYSLVPACIKNKKGFAIFIVNADQNGKTTDKGIYDYLPENIIGYYTDQRTFAIAFIYKNGLNDPECIYITDCPQVSIPATIAEN